MVDPQELDRLAALAGFEILDTAPEPLFDSLTQLAALTFDTPIALITMVDDHRQWFKSCVGLTVDHTARDISFCQYAIVSDAPLIVLDARLDPRFADTPLVTGPPYIRFYAGAPLTTASGHRLGTLCVIDTVPRDQFDATQVGKLQALADSVMQALELRLAARERARLEVVSQESKALLVQAESMAGVGTWFLDVGTDKTTWSDEVYRIHGIDPSNGSPELAEALACYRPDDARMVGECIRRAVATGEAFDLQARIVRPDGEERDVLVRGDCRRSADGVVSGLFGAFQDVTALRLADMALRESEARSRHLLDNASDLIIRLNDRGVVIDVSPACRIYGYAPHEIIGLQTVSFVHPDDLAVAVAARDDNFEGEGPNYDLVREYRLRNKDGSYRWVQGSPTVLRDTEGAVSEVITILRDISQRKNAEIALAESEARLRYLLDNSTDMIIRTGVDGSTLEVSPGCRQFGYEPEEIMAASQASFLHPDDLERALAARADNFGDHGPDRAIVREYRFRTKSGAYRWIQGNPTAIRAVDGSVLQIISAFRDVTQKKESEFALAEKEAHYRLLAENARDIITCYDAAGHATYVSPAVAAILGYEPQELIGTKPWVLLHPDDVKPTMARVAAYVAKGPGATSIRYEYRAFRKDGTMVWLEASAKAIFEPGTDRLVELQDAVRDVSARKALEIELSAARDTAVEAIAVKSDFLANMSHEIRTPLTAILGFSSLLSARSDLTETAMGYVRRVSGASKALLAIVNDILDFSKLEAGQMSISNQSVDVSELAQDAIAMFAPQAEEKSLWLEFNEVSPAPPSVLIDPDRVRQILLNLIGNAIKFTDAGIVRLGMAYDPDHSVLRFEVEDTGSGMDEIQCEKLFQRFSQVDASSTRRHGGTGLGLAISKALVEAMDGDIGVTSVPGQGSTFYFEIHAPEGNALRPAEINLQGDDANLTGIRVLLADDNASNRVLARLLLEQLGAEVTEVADGQQVLDAAAQAPFDVILLDLHMPVMDGAEALSRLHANDGPNQNVPVLAFTADTSDSALNEGGGFDGIVGKPIVVAEFVSELERVTRWQDPAPSAEGRYSDVG